VPADERRGEQGDGTPWSPRSLRISKAARCLVASVRGARPGRSSVTSALAILLLRQVFTPPGGLRYPSPTNALASAWMRPEMRPFAFRGSKVHVKNS